MNILIRMPNWLGDLIMAYPFVKAVKAIYPSATVDLICKENLCELANLFPEVNQVFPFSKKTYGGLFGGRKFAIDNFKGKEYDFFFTLPDSFSAAWIGKFINAKRRVGYANEGRSFLLSDALAKKTQTHRSEQYLDLLRMLSEKEIEANKQPFFNARLTSRKNQIALSLRSVAASRSLTKSKAISLCNELADSLSFSFVFTGTKADHDFYQEVSKGLKEQDRFYNAAGETSLPQLLSLLSDSTAFLGVDSGTAHVANAAGVSALVLFGAGNEQETRGFFETEQMILRKPEVDCAPCLSNSCKFKDAHCINELSDKTIGDALQQVLKNQSLRP